MILEFLKRSDFRGTCSVTQLVNNSVTFVRNGFWFNKLRNSVIQQQADNGPFEILVLAPTEVGEMISSLGRAFTEHLKYVIVTDVERLFVEYHNWFYKDSTPPENKIDYSKCDIHETVVIGADAMKYIYEPLDMPKPVQMKHMGRVVIENGVKVFPYATIHRGSMGDTIIKENVIIGAYVNVGHNVVIENNSCINPYVCLGGSSHIGRGCVIGMGSVIRDGITLGDRVKIGMGSNVVKSINEPGVYLGNPAKKVGEWSGRFHN